MLEFARMKRTTKKIKIAIKTYAKMSGLAKKRYAKIKSLAYAKASVTVEAVLVVQVILGILFSIMILIFTLHDSIVLSSLKNIYLVSGNFEGENSVLESENKQSEEGSQRLIYGLKSNFDGEMETYADTQLILLSISDVKKNDSKLMKSLSIAAATEIKIPIVKDFLNETIETKSEGTKVNVRIEDFLKERLEHESKQKKAQQSGDND